MIRALLICLILAALASASRADRLLLQDGRTFDGEVTVEDQAVTIRMSYGTFSFPKDQVTRIERQATPESQLQAMLKHTPPNDADALFVAAQWASEHGLPKEADSLHKQVLALKPDHAASRKALGFIKIDNEWRTFEQGMELAHSKLQAACYDQLANSLLPELEELAASRDRLADIRELSGLTQLRLKNFQTALRVFQELSGSATGAAALRYTAIAEILRECPQGAYILTEDHPADSALLGGDRRSLKAGPVSLADPLALDAALRQKAKAEVDAARKILDEARKLEATDSDAAKVKYIQAGKLYDRADAMVPNIARSYRIEIARRRIATLRKYIDADAARFDAQMEKLARESMTGEAYEGVVVRMIHQLDTVRSNLTEVLDIAKPFPRELILEIKWAELDLQRIDSMKTILRSELHGQS